ncbi:stage V sporulation protein AD [Sulfobacillus harzensis]|nr:stage V sporulation protein AD [Sulfobacillus harzensis]
MAVDKIGQATYAVQGVYIQGTGSVVGPKEGQGPLGQQFDRVWKDERAGQATFEKAEQALLIESYDEALKKAQKRWEDIELVVGGDLLDQIITTNFSARQHGRPTLGLFSACATFTEALAVGALLIGGNGPKTVLASAASHHQTAERQFRFPVELGYQRTPTTAWTATAAGAVVLSEDVGPLAIEAVTVGRVVDIGGKDPNDMGSAMAPAAFDTISQHLQDTGQEPGDFDKIYTGDLGHFGIKMLIEYAAQKGLQFGDELDDCGRSLYNQATQDTHNGGSGPGCSASVFAGPLARRLVRGDWDRILLVATGALFSPTTYQQGETIPCVAHAVAIKAVRGAGQ